MFLVSLTVTTYSLTAGVFAVFTVDLRPTTYNRATGTLNPFTATAAERIEIRSFTPQVDE